MLLLAPPFISGVDFKVFVPNSTGCRDHDFNQVVILTLEKRGDAENTTFCLLGSILRSLFATLLGFKDMMEIVLILTQKRGD